MLNMEERMLVAAISKEMAQAKEEKQKQRENERNRKNAQLPSSGQALSSLNQDSLPPPAPFPPSEEGIPPIPDDGTLTDTPVPNTSSGNNPAITENVSTLSYIPGKGAEAMLFYRKELLLVQVLIRYGENYMLRRKRTRRRSPGQCGQVHRLCVARRRFVIPQRPS